MTQSSTKENARFALEQLIKLRKQPLANRFGRREILPVRTDEMSVLLLLSFLLQYPNAIQNLHTHPRQYVTSFW